VRGAARLVGQLGINEAARPLADLLERDDPPCVAPLVDACQHPHAAAMEALQKALTDEDREVRIAAARGLGALRYPPARERLDELLDSRTVRDADLTEKIAFFEAYAVIGGEESVTVSTAS
jgi:hypothetical protein